MVPDSLRSHKLPRKAKSGVLAWPHTDKASIVGQI